MIVLVLVGFALVLGAASFATELQKRGAESALAEAKANGAALQAEISKYAAVPAVQAELANATNARLYVGATEVRWQSLLLSLRGVMPAGVNIATMNFADTSPGGVTGPAAGPFATAGIGSVSFGGVSLEYPDVALLERGIDSVRGLTDAHIPAVTRVVGQGSIVYTFSGTATLTAQALDLRFTDAWFVDYKRETAGAYLASYLTESETAVSAAQASGAAGAAALKTALADRDAALAARDTFASLTAALSTAKADLATATTAKANGEKDADAAVTAAQAKVDALGAGLDQLTASVLAVRDSRAALGVASTRVTAAQVLVTAKQAQLTSAKAALASATTDRAALQASVDSATKIVSEAEAVLKKETDTVAPATAAVTTAKAALITATSAAKSVLVTAAVPVAPKATTTVAPKSTTNPTAPVPGTSATPSTTKRSAG
jgi:hypothetical protein